MPPLLETDIGTAVVQWLDQQPRVMAIFSEVPIILTGQTVSMDLVAVIGCDEEKDVPGSIALVECKRSLTNALIHQCRRGLGLFDYIYAAVEEPGQTTEKHLLKRGRLEKDGIGLLYVNKAMQTNAQIAPRRQPNHNHALIDSALSDRQLIGNCVAGPGSAGVKRAKRDKWERVRYFLGENGPSTMRILKTSVVGYTKDDWREFAKLVHKEQVDGVREDNLIGAGVLKYYLDSGED